jgi:hypothetical protein
VNSNATAGLLLLQILTKECVEPYIVARLIEQHNLSTSWFFDTHAPKKQRLILSFPSASLGALSSFFALLYHVLTFPLTYHRTFAMFRTAKSNVLVRQVSLALLME